MALSPNSLFASWSASFFRTVKGGSRAMPVEGDARILCFTGSGLGNTLDTFPLFHALRRHFPKAHVTVACDAAAAAIAGACPAVNDVIVLETGWNFWSSAMKVGARLQHYDWALAATGGYSSRAAMLCRISNAKVRIGFEKHPTGYYTDAVALPDTEPDEHQIETMLRLLKPLGLVNPRGWSVDLNLQVPDASREFAAELLLQPPFDGSRSFMLINLGDDPKIKFREEDFIGLIGRVLGSANVAVGLLTTPSNQTFVEEVAVCMGSKRIVTIEPPGPLEAAALLERALFVITPEDEIAHLAAAVGAPAVVLWPETASKKTCSRGVRHVFVQAEPKEKSIPLDRAWKAVQPFLAPEQGSARG